MYDDVKGGREYSGVEVGIGMKLLDLFCGAGGCSVGYARAGFEVVGVDVNPQPRYPFEFHQMDWLEYLSDHWREFDVIAASPRCQLDSVTASLFRGDCPREEIGQVQEALRWTGKPFAIENVLGAPLVNPLMLCGTMFGLRVQRHRLFECHPTIWWPPASCCHWGKATGNHLRRSGKTHTPGFSDGYAFITVAGNNYLAHEGRTAMGIDWMVRTELSQAIPPKYTEFVGNQIKELI